MFWNGPRLCLANPDRAFGGRVRGRHRKERGKWGAYGPRQAPRGQGYSVTAVTVDESGTSSRSEAPSSVPPSDRPPVVVPVTAPPS